MGFGEIMIAVAFAATAAVGGAADSVMRRQADGFLQALPDGLQQTQTLAVEKAIAGDNAALMAVRNSRNTRQTLSENVSVRQLSESLRLYEPSGVDGRLPLLVYFHGGGWTFGSLNSCARFCDAVAAMGGVKVLAVDYRLAPERTARLLRCGGIRPRQCRFVGHRRIAHQRRRRQLGRQSCSCCGSFR